MGYLLGAEANFPVSGLPLPSWLFQPLTPTATTLGGLGEPALPWDLKYPNRLPPTANRRDGGAVRH